MQKEVIMWANKQSEAKVDYTANKKPRFARQPIGV